MPWSIDTANRKLDENGDLSIEVTGLITTTGDAAFKGNVDLPKPCIAPIVFVTNGTGDPPGGWFSVTGV